MKHAQISWETYQGAYFIYLTVRNIGLGQKVHLVFSVQRLYQSLAVFNSETILLVQCDSCHVSMRLRKTTGEFLCSHFNIEDTQHFRSIMLYYFNKGKNTTEMQKKICAASGEGAVTDRTCEKWFAKFLGTVTFWPNNSVLWGCLTHWKMFSSTPGLYPLEANSGRQLTYSEYPHQ